MFRLETGKENAPSSRVSASPRLEFTVWVVHFLLLKAAFESLRVQKEPNLYARKENKKIGACPAENSTRNDALLSASLPSSAVQ